jgi:hypothetical protein
MDKEQLDREMARVACEKCGDSFETQPELDEHDRSQHGAATGGIPSQERIPRTGS